MYTVHIRTSQSCLFLFTSIPHGTHSYWMYTVHCSSSHICFGIQLYTPKQQSHTDYHFSKPDTGSGTSTLTSATGHRTNNTVQLHTSKLQFTLNQDKTTYTELYMDIQTQTYQIHQHQFVHTTLHTGLLAIPSLLHP